jgi:hypothetical protein
MYIVSKFCRGPLWGKKVNPLALGRSLSSTSTEITVELGDVFETHSMFDPFFLVFGLNFTIS